MNQNDDDSTDWMIDDDDAAPVSRHGAAAATMPVLPPWRVLIVDDDVDVHVVTKFSLSNACFMGRRLSFLHAYSGEEALTTLRATPDIALVLLDVIMETSDAGLRVARQIRDVLDNQLVRIVLRTGQPGQALEHSIILDYDINDFWCKTDLTTRKLFTTVISSLRAYSGLEIAARKLADVEAELARHREQLDAVNRHALLMTLGPKGKIISVNDRLCELLQFSREELVGTDPRMLHQPAYPADQLGDAQHALAAGETWNDVATAFRRDGTPLRLRLTVTPVLDNDGKPLRYLLVASPA